MYNIINKNSRLSTIKRVSGKNKFLNNQLCHSMCLLPIRSWYTYPKYIILLVLGIVGLIYIFYEHVVIVECFTLFIKYCGPSRL